MSSDSPGCGALCLAAGFLLGVFALVMNHSDQASVSHSVTVTAAVLRITPDNGDEGAEVARVRYPADGRVVTTDVVVHGQVQPGGTLTVGYDPRHPASALNPPPTHSIETGTYLAGALAAVLVVVGLLALL